MICNCKMDFELQLMIVVQHTTYHCKQWYTLIRQPCLQVHKAAILGYTGEGSPPHIEMMITAVSDKTTPPDLTVEAKLKGVQTEPSIIKFEREAQNVFECVCQVFYHKIALNHWRARVAFFPKQCYEVLYHSFNFEFQ